MEIKNFNSEFSDSAKKQLVSYLQPFFHPKQPHKVRDLKLVITNSSGIQTGVCGDAGLDFAYEIAGWKLLADVSGDVVVDIWSAPTSSYPPTSGNSITGVQQPTLSAAAFAQSTDISTWQKRVDLGYSLRFNIDSVDTITRLTIVVAVVPI